MAQKRKSNLAADIRRWTQMKKRTKGKDEKSNTDLTPCDYFQTTPQNITLHLKNIFKEGELSEAATCKNFLQVQTEGTRQAVIGVTS